MVWRAQRLACGDLVVEIRLAVPLLSATKLIRWRGGRLHARPEGSAVWRLRRRCVRLRKFLWRRIRDLGADRGEVVLRR
ncbi:MAG: hypothetical protein ACRDT8_22755, partial [Micromonosporaceae bacterium]